MCLSHSSFNGQKNLLFLDLKAMESSVSSVDIKYLQREENIVGTGAPESDFHGDFRTLIPLTIC